MVINNSREVYICPYCGEEYDDWDDAEECAKDCAPIDDVIERQREEYQCEICNDKFDLDDVAYKQALECERKHREMDDVKYQDYLCAQRKVKMLEASQHKSQKKLV